MTIRRAPRPKRNYTTIPNAAIEDGRLSFKALGVLVYLLSKPDNWTVNRDHLAATHTDGTEAVRSALRELRAAGYITTETERAADGRIAGQGAVVHDEPQAEQPPQPPPSGGKPATRATLQPEKPRVVSTEVEQPLIEQGVVTSREQLTLVAPPTPAAQRLAVGQNLGSDRDLAFVAFWGAYPLRTGKGQARKAWVTARRRGVTPEVIVRGAMRYAADPNRDPAFTKHPATWLTGECWDDEPLPDRTMSVAGPPRSAAGRTVSTLRKVLHSQAQAELPSALRGVIGDGK